MVMIAPDIHWPVIIIACCFMLMDIITGLVQAIINRNVDSQIMKKGLLHKCGFLLAIIFGCLCEYAMAYVDLGFTLPIQNTVCIYIIVMEVMSILENLSKISPELATSKFMEIFKMHDKHVPESNVDKNDE